MASVVSLLPDEYTQRVKDLRVGLHDELGISTPLEGPPPHFTYQLAERYDVDALQPVLERIAENEDSFTIRTNGVALFTDTEPVVYIPVTRNRQLTALHQRIWDKVAGPATTVADYYRPETWMPHITIGLLNHDEVPRVIEYLHRYDFRWEIEIETIAYLQGSGAVGMTEHL